MTTLILILPWLISLVKSYPEKKVFKRNLIILLQSAVICFFAGAMAFYLFPPDPKKFIDLSLLPFFVFLLLVLFGVGVWRLVVTFKFLKSNGR